MRATPNALIALNRITSIIIIQQPQMMCASCCWYVSYGCLVFFAVQCSFRSFCCIEHWCARFHNIRSLITSRVYRIHTCAEPYQVYIYTPCMCIFIHHTMTGEKKKIKWIMRPVIQCVMMYVIRCKVNRIAFNTEFKHFMHKIELLHVFMMFIQVACRSAHHTSSTHNINQ